MRRKLGRHVERSATWGVNPYPPGVQMQLAADAAGQERPRPAIFGVANDRMADRRHVRAKLMGTAGQRLKLEPGRSVARVFDGPPARLGWESVLLADMHFLAA